MARSKEPPPPIPSLAALLGCEPYWSWLYCNNAHKCRHHRAMPLAPFVIRWGADGSSDVPRRCARCTVCGHKGATMIHPSMGSEESGVYQPFPTGVRQKGGRIGTPAPDLLRGLKVSAPP
jgi:hypothetical protein